jgi:hypothetical protein
MLIEYLIHVHHPDLHDEGIDVRINGLGKNEIQARSDAMRQARAFIEHLAYDIEQVRVLKSSRE